VHPRPWRDDCQERKNRSWGLEIQSVFDLRRSAAYLRVAQQFCGRAA
jgi:hypothetical protein